jgi:tRNA_anti-like
MNKTLKKVLWVVIGGPILLFVGLVILAATFGPSAAERAQLNKDIATISGHLVKQGVDPTTVDAATVLKYAPSGMDSATAEAIAKEMRSAAKKEAPKAEAAKAESKGPTVQASELVDAYKSNEIAADKIYKGEWYSITGFVDSIGKDILDDPYVTIGEGAKFEVNTVQCMLTGKGSKVAEQLSKGTPVRAYGKIEGFVLLNVLVRKCELNVTN